MGRIKDFYFDSLVNEDEDIYGDILKDFDLPLPTEKELKRVAKVVRKTHREDYEEITGRTLPVVETEELVD